MKVLGLLYADLPFSQDQKSSQEDGSKPSNDDGKKDDEDLRKDSEYNNQEKEDNVNSTNNVNVASTNEVNAVGAKTSIELPVDPDMPELDDYSIFEYDEDVGAEADMNNLDTTIQVSPIPTIRIHKDYPLNQLIGDLQSATQTRNMSKNLEEYEFVSNTLKQRTNHKDLQNCLFACFLSQEEPRKIEEEVYVCQPLGFEDLDFSDRVYKVEKTLYRLHQAPRAWYETLSTYPLDNGFQRGKIDNTLFIKRCKGAILLVQVYVDDIIFGSTKKEICIAFKKFIEVKTASTPIETQKPLLKDKDGEEVDVHMYRSMIGSLMYLTSSRPEIMFAVCACARYQVNPKVSHLHDVKRIFRYLKGQPKLDLWYPKDTPFDLVAYTDSDYAGASLDRKSTTGDFLTKAFDAKNVNEEVQLQALVDGKKIIITESIMRRDLQLEDAEGVDCLPNATIFEQLTLMGLKTSAWNEFSGTMASAIICLAINQKFNFSKYIFESMVKNLDNAGKFLMYPRFVQVFLDKQVDGKASHKRIYIAPSHTKKIFGNMRRVGKGFSGRETPLFQTMVAQDQAEMGKGEAINEEMDDSLVRAVTTASSLEAEQDSGNIDKTQSKATPNEPSSSGTSSGGYTLQSGEDSLKLQELMALCITLQSRVLALETTKTTQANEIASFKRRVKKLERRNKSRTHRLKRIADIDANEDIYLVNVQTDEDMFGVNDLDGDEVIVKSVDVVNTAEETRSVVEEVTDVTILVSASTTTTTTTAITNVEITLAQALAELKSAKPKADKEQAPTPIVSSQQPSQVNLKKKKKKKRLAIEKAQQVKEANIAWDDVQAKIEADYQLAQRLKHFIAKRAEEKRNKPPTRAQQRSIMCTYLKNMEGWKPKSLKNKSFANIQELFDKAMKRVNTFVDYKTKLVEESSKKAETELVEEKEDKESEELKQCLEIVLNDRDDVTIDATPLSTKSPTIVDFKIYKEGKKSYFQIIRADDNSQMYLTFGKMLKNFDREDLEVLWSIVKARFKKTEQVNYMDNFLLLNLKTMFEHHVEDNVWKNQQGLVKVLNWKLYDSCGVHCITMQSMLFYLLVEKMYPLTNHTLHHMFKDVKLQVDYECEMAFELLRLVKKQLKEGYIVCKILSSKLDIRKVSYSYFTMFSWDGSDAKYDLKCFDCCNYAVQVTHELLSSYYMLCDACCMMFHCSSPTLWARGERYDGVEEFLNVFISDSLLLTPLCCDDIHDVTPRVSALAGCDRLVSEPLVIEK
ncbi:putative ribonuclease H-like domain-containing protein [Tanacetum coccineum]